MKKNKYKVNHVMNLIIIWFFSSQNKFYIYFLEEEWVLTFATTRTGRSTGPNPSPRIFTSGFLSSCIGELNHFRSHFVDSAHLWLQCVTCLHQSCWWIYIGTNLNLDPQNWIIEENSMPRLHRLKTKVLNSSGANFDLT